MSEPTTKVCTKCGVEKALEQYSKKSEAKDGRRSECKDCWKLYRQANRETIIEKRKLYHQANRETLNEKSKLYHQANRETINEKRKLYRQANSKTISERKKLKHRNDPRRKMLMSAKRRAKEKNLPFNLTIDDIYIPKYCPLIGIPLVVVGGGASPGSPSLDRIKPELGYIKGNVMVISNMANMMKSNATIEQLRSLARNLHMVMEEYPLTPEKMKTLWPQEYTKPQPTDTKVNGEEQDSSRGIEGAPAGGGTQQNNMDGEVAGAA